MPQNVNKIYTDRAFLYEMYVKKRMNLKDIQEFLLKKYNIQITTQAIYNHCKKHDLLKYRGKGKRLGANLQQKQAKPKRPQNPNEKRLRERAKQRKRGRGR